MTWPFISRSSHEAIMRLLQVQVDELKAERTVLLDRLGRIGLGGELFKIQEYAEQEPEPEEPETMEDRINKILAQRRQPNAVSQAIRKLAVEEMKKRGTGPDVKWVPSTVAALDAVEEEAKKA